MTATDASLNATGTLLCKLWDNLCLPDSPAVRAASARMDLIVKAYCRGDTRLVADWVQTARALSDASVAAKGKPLPADFIMAPIVVARGVTEKGTPVPPPAVVVVTKNDKGQATETEVAVLADGTQVKPQGAMPIASPDGPGSTAGPSTSPTTMAYQPPPTTTGGTTQAIPPGATVDPTTGTVTHTDSATGVVTQVDPVAGTVTQANPVTGASTTQALPSGTTVDLDTRTITVPASSSADPSAAVRDAQGGSLLVPVLIGLAVVKILIK